jgi:hypothetical protein
MPSGGESEGRGPEAKRALESPRDCEAGPEKGQSAAVKNAVGPPRRASIEKFLPGKDRAPPAPREEWTERKPNGGGGDGVAARLLHPADPTKGRPSRHHERKERTMTEGHELETSLLAEIGRRTKEISETQHELARQQRVLSRAATLLRLGKTAPGVLAEIREQCPDLLQEYCDLQVTLTPPPPLRPVPRAAASA